MRSFPWDSIVTAIGDDGYPILDRAFGADDLRDVYTAFFTDGVFMDVDEAFHVVAADGMNVNVYPGKCMIEGTVGVEKNIRKLAVQAASSQDRIDTVVLRWNDNRDMRNIDLYVKTGVAADVPTRPSLTRNETVKELGLCDIYVAKNTTTIVDQRITDTRLDTERCGIVTPFATIDTTTFYTQLQAAIDANVAELEKQTDVAVELAQSAIDGTTAGNLQNQITSNDEDIERIDISLGEISDRLNNAFEIRGGGVAITKSYSISSNSTASLTMNAPDISGMIPYVICGYSTGTPNVVLYYIRYTGAHTIGASLKNLTSSNISGTFTVDVLYIREDMFKD